MPFDTQQVFDNIVNVTLIVTNEKNITHKIQYDIIIIIIMSLQNRQLLGICFQFSVSFIFKIFEQMVSLIFS